jgi:hypothetical protein
MSDDALYTPASARAIAAYLGVTEAAVKQHLLRPYTKLKIPEGQNRRIRLANEVVALGLARPELPEDHRGTPPPVSVAPALIVSRQPTSTLTAVKNHGRVRSDQRGITGRTAGPV